MSLNDKIIKTEEDKWCHDSKTTATRNRNKRRKSKSHRKAEKTIFNIVNLDELIEHDGNYDDDDDDQI